MVQLSRSKVETSTNVVDNIFRLPVKSVSGASILISPSIPSFESASKMLL
ncbi:hypothetical protein QUF74_12415 [Candidatus Halobeggiatoa sp. HSG11]|nr:hypothetical protein [Candidatus Halobeggiatoa sp. HSG11]